MIKKVSIIGLLFVTIIVFISTFSNIYAVTGEEVLNSTQATELVEIKESAKNNVSEYIEKYGSTPFGVTAYVLNIVYLVALLELL